MNVSGCSTLEQSFEKYCEQETLDGDNMYHAGDTFGKQVPFPLLFVRDISCLYFFRWLPSTLNSSPSHQFCMCI